MSNLLKHCIKTAKNFGELRGETWPWLCSRDIWRNLEMSLCDEKLHKRQRCGHSRRGNKLQCPIHLRRWIQPAATQDRIRLFQNANLLNESAIVQ